MFRRVERTMEPDPVFRSDLCQLGFFINRLGQVRRLEAPDQPFTYDATNNGRVNKAREEAMRECFRRETGKRLAALGINKVYLPDYTTTKPEGPHIPILASSHDVLKTRKRVIVLISDQNQDLGILAYRQLQHEKGLNGGSVVNLIKELIQRSHKNKDDERTANIFDDGFAVASEDNAPGLIVLNTGQLNYSHKHNKAMSLHSWHAMPRKSCMHGTIQIHPEENSVAGHRSHVEHVKSVLNEVVYDANRVSPDAELYVIAIASGAQNIVEVLEEDFANYGSRITAMALIDSGVAEIQVKDVAVRTFLHQRSREFRHSHLTSNPECCIQVPTDYHKYTKNFCMSITSSPKHISWMEQVSANDSTEDGSNAPMNNMVADSSITEVNIDSTEWFAGQSAICPTFAAGESDKAEDMLTSRNLCRAILSFFEEVSQDVKHYCNPLFQIVEDNVQPRSDNALVLDQEGFPVVDAEQWDPSMSIEQAELDAANAALGEMSSALSACPNDTPKVAKGREKLTERIANQRIKIQELEKAALAHGSLRAGEATIRRENWRPQAEGPQVKFAGTMVDSELLRAAGLGETADEALREQQSEVGDPSSAS